MSTLVILVALTALSQVNARIVELSCSDNATCINNLAKELARGVRQQKTVRLFDLFTLEPLNNREARGNLDPLTRMLKSYAISFDWNDYTFRFSNPNDEKLTLDLEVFESRSIKDVTATEQLPKKSSSKVEEESPEDKHESGSKVGLKRRRHRKRKVLQAVFPMLFGMKSAGAAIFALAAVTVLTLKAFFASKMALGVTVYMAMKKFYESYGNGVPETSNVLWNLARYFRFLFGLPESPQLSSPSMSMPMYVMPQMGQMADQMQMYAAPTMAAPTQ